MCGCMLVLGWYRWQKALLTKTIYMNYRQTSQKHRSLLPATSRFKAKNYQCPSLWHRLWRINLSNSTGRLTSYVFGISAHNMYFYVTSHASLASRTLLVLYIKYQNPASHAEIMTVLRIIIEIDTRSECNYFNSNTIVPYKKWQKRVEI